MLDSVRFCVVVAAYTFLGHALAAQNLIENPGCEATPGAIPPPGWTTTDGEDFYCSSGFGITPPHSGGLYFSVYPTAESPLVNTMQQDVDVTSLSTPIDAGTQSFRFEAFHGHANVGQDLGWIRLTFLDDTDQELGAWDSGNLVDPGGVTWSPITTKQVAPVGTRKVRVTVRCLRTHPTYCGVQYDDIALFNGAYLGVRAFLEGPYDAASDTMSTDLAANGLLPLDQPFSDPSFDGTALDFDSTIVAGTHPGSTVDWLLASLRTGPASGTEVVGTTQPVVLYEDGSVGSIGADSLRFPGLADGSYYLVLRSRNHLDVMSATPINVTDGIGAYDFTTDATQAYPGDDLSVQSELETGVWGMLAGDASLDGQVTANDFNRWLADTKAAALGYVQSDFNADGQVTATDFNLWLTNTKLAASSKVP